MHTKINKQTNLPNEQGRQHYVSWISSFMANGIPHLFTSFIAVKETEVSSRWVFCSFRKLVLFGLGGKINVRTLPPKKTKAQHTSLSTIQITKFVLALTQQFISLLITYCSYINFLFHLKATRQTLFLLFWLKITFLY